MKQAFHDIVGNRALCERLYSDLTEGRLAHAYILEGAEGTGKHTIAKAIAAAIACERRNDPDVPFPCRACASCRKVLTGNSVDVIYINRGEKATLGVDAIRDLKSDVCIAPNDISAKIYIIEDAHLMTVQAQNALLLTLEEPPEYVLFLLLCESTAQLLETVRSRAPTLRTEPIPTEQIGEHLCRVSHDAELLRRNSPQEFSEILICSGGSIGRALALLDPKARRPILARRETAREFTMLAAERRNGIAVSKWIMSLASKKRDEVIEPLCDTLLCLRDLLLLKQTENAPLCFFSDREEALSLAYRFTTPRLLRLCDVLSETVEKLRKNANLRLALIALATSAGML